MKKTQIAILSGVGALVLTGFYCYGRTASVEPKDMTTRTEESAVTTNANGTVSHTFMECTVTTNGCMVTERRRETRTNMDMEGNVLETSTSEYAQSFNVGTEGVASLMASSASQEKADESQKAAPSDSFLGLKFGAEFDGTNFVKDASEPLYLRATFTPKKTLAGFDDYYVYVTPKTHRVAKIHACAKEVVDPCPGANWRQHCLIEALEKRYGTWAKLCSYRRPCYAFSIGNDRYVTACLAGASRDYQTVISAWDNSMGECASTEFEELRDEARKSAIEKWNRRVSDAVEAF